MSKNRLLYENDVIKAADKHIKEDGTLDDDISCILEEVKEVKDVMSETKLEITPQMNLSQVVPRVFMFKTDLPINEIAVIQGLQEFLKKQIEEGCLVIPDDVEFIGVEEPVMVLP